MPLVVHHRSGISLITQLVVQIQVTMTPSLPLRTTLLKSKVLGTKGKEALSASTQTIGIGQKGDFPGQECHNLSAFAYASLEAAFQYSST